MRNPRRCIEGIRAFYRFVVAGTALLAPLVLLVPRTAEAANALTCGGGTIAGTIDGANDSYAYAFSYFDASVTAATCAAPGNKPGVTGSAAKTSFRYVQIPFKNPSSTAQCFTFRLTSSAPNLMVHATNTSPWYANGAPFLGFSGPVISTDESFAIQVAGDQLIYLVVTDVKNFEGPAVSTSFTLSASNCPTVSAEATPNPAVYGQPVTLAAMLSGDSGNPTGSVTFKDNGTSVGTATVMGPRAQLTTISLGAGAHTITALYNGGGAYASAANTVDLTVNKAATTTALAASSSPQVPGEEVTFTATLSVTSPGAGKPTGTVSFMDGATPLGTVAVDSSIATLKTSALPVGSHSIVATYSGDANFESSTKTFEQSIVAGATTIAVVATPESVTFGDDATVGATLSSSSKVAFTGALEFSEAGKTLGTVQLDGASANLKLSKLGAGPHTIDVAYAGDDNHEACSGSVTLDIAQASSATALTSSASTVVAGQSFSLSAKVTTKPGAATGTVTFVEGTTTLGTATLSDGIASLDIASLAVGSHGIQAKYAGDSNTSASTSATLTLVITEAAAAPSPEVDAGTVGPSSPTSESGCASTDAPLSTSTVSTGGIVLIAVAALLARRRRAA